MKKLAQAGDKIKGFFRGGKKRQLGLVFVGLMAVGGTIMLIRSFAAAPEIYLTPSSSTVSVNNNFTVTLRINPGTSVDSVDATITYDATKLQYVSMDAASSVFPLALVGTGGSGTVHVARGVLSPTTVSTDSEVVKVTFKALTSGNALLQLSGSAAFAGSPVNLTAPSASVTVTSPTPQQLTATYTIEPSTATPVVNTSFGLKVYVDSNANMQGGEVKVNLPAGMTYSGTLDTTGTAFSPVTTVTGTTSQLVYLVFTTQSQTLTGKQLVATIPVTSTTTGAKSITFTGARLIDINDFELTTVTAQPVSLTVNSPIAKPTLGRPGKAQLSASEDITDLKQAFTISNYDSAAVYTVTFAGVTITQTAGSFSIPATIKNGNHTLQVAVSKNGTSDSASHTVRLRSPNINRLTCVELFDLLAVNKAYGTASTESDLNFDGTVSLVDLLTVTTNWGSACVN